MAPSQVDLLCKMAQGRSRSTGWCACVQDLVEIWKKKKKKILFKRRNIRALYIGQQWKAAKSIRSGKQSEGPCLCNKANCRKMLAFGTCDANRCGLCATQNGQTNHHWQRSALSTRSWRWWFPYTACYITVAVGVYILQKAQEHCATRKCLLGATADHSRADF